MDNEKKVINITIAYEDSASGMKHSIKQKIETFKELPEIMDQVRSFEQGITGVVPMI